MSPSIRQAVFVACLLSFSTTLFGQGKPPSAAPAADPRAIDDTKVPPKKVLSTEPRKQPDSENVPPVKIGATLETTADGVLVRVVTPGSAADEAGLRQGDLIIRLAGKQVLTPYAIDRRFHSYRAGTSLEVVVLRSGKEATLKIVLPKDHEPVLLDKPRRHRIQLRRKRRRSPWSALAPSILAGHCWKRKARSW